MHNPLGVISLSSVNITSIFHLLGAVPFSTYFPLLYHISLGLYRGGIEVYGLRKKLWLTIYYINAIIIIGKHCMNMIMRLGVAKVEVVNCAVLY